MATITISLSEDIKEFIEAQVGEEFASESEYLADLVRRDQEARVAELRRIVEEARASGVSNRTVDDIFEEAVERVRAKGVLRA